MRFLLFSFFLLAAASFSAMAQNEVEISGVVSDSLGNAIPFATITIEGRNVGCSANEAGQFKLRVPAGVEVSLVVQSLGYQQVLIHRKFTHTKPLSFTVMLAPKATSLNEVSVIGEDRQMGNSSMLNPKVVELMPNVGGGFETMLKSIPGVTSNNELSSQYSVRGGSFDENLVYINDIEVYRPFLIRSGQQEGLSAINPDMVGSVEFSTGGFDADKGDKMSSALNIRYRKPVSFHASASASLLGASASVEGTALKGRLTHISGYRYKTSKYLLGTLDTKGEYYPSFSDFQTFINYDISSTVSASVLGSYATNKYEFYPMNRETSFGLLSNPLGFKVYYDGWEHNTYQTGLTAATLTFRPAASLALKFIASSYLTNERETYDILGEYWINELDNSLGSSTYSDSLVNVGIGSFLNHARNSLDAYVYSFEHKGTYVSGNSTLQWGVKVQRERVFDNVKEWQLIDSAGYSLPTGGNGFSLYSSASARNRFDAYRHSGYLQEKYGFSVGEAEFLATAGVRATYSMLNGELNISPRFSVTYTPHANSPLSFHLSGGAYVQPPFIKELQDETGKMNFDLKAQKSIQLVAGSRYDFKAFGKPFRFTSEIYYKQLSNLEPYKMDNIQVTYAGKNIAKGYAYGADFKVNGELLPDAESWLSLSFLNTREDVEGDSYIAADGAVVHPGYFPRPTDQRLNLSMFFQDYLAGNPTVRVHLTLQYGTGLPFFSPEKNRWDNYFRMPSYRRVDIGFTKVLIDNPTRKKVSSVTGLFRSLMLTVEVFNLLDINNTVSYLWVRTVGNQEGIPNMLAIPNYLTSRRFNLRLSAKF